jgi:hypothetical protein
VARIPPRGRLLALLTTVLALVLTLIASATDSGVGSQPSLAAAKTDNHTKFGMSVPSLEGETSSEQAAALAAMKNIGLRWVRIDANWSWIQYGGPTSFDWSVLDQAVRAILASGMYPDLIIDDAPPWARATDARADWGEPASAHAYATFAGQVAARYGPMGVSTYEIWNEPNIVAFWYPAPNPGLYTKMLKDAYAAIKVSEPNATVISGGLAPTTDSGRDISPVAFLTDMYADGAESSFDALGYHAYSYPALPDMYESWSGWSELDQTTPSIRSVMIANGDGDKQVWITEIGAPSAGRYGVGTTAQAEEVTQAVHGARSHSWIAAMFFYTYRDAATDPDYFGLLKANGKPKPAWKALAAALS